MREHVSIYIYIYIYENILHVTGKQQLGIVTASDSSQANLTVIAVRMPTLASNTNFSDLKTP
jgi:hypothetical protein